MFIFKLSTIECILIVLLGSTFFTITSADSKHTSFNGLIEFELVKNNYDTPNQNMNSDIYLSQFIFDVTTNFNKDIKSTIVFLYENDGERLINLDVVKLTFRNVGISDFNMVVGAIYVPFGTFDTFLVNDTLIQEIAEIREDTLLFNYTKNNISLSSYFFNNIQKINNDISFGINVGYAKNNVVFGIDYVSNIADSIGARDSFSPPLMSNADYPEAMLIHFHYDFGNMTILSEYFRSEDFNEKAWGLSPIGIPHKPESWHLEFGVKLRLWTLAFGYQKSDNAVIFGIPKKRISIAARTPFTDNVSLALEYWQDDYYAISEGGANINSNNFVVQLAILF